MRFEPTISAGELPQTYSLDLGVTGTGNITQYKSRPVTGLEWPTGFQEVKVPRFHDNGTGKW